MLSKNDEYALSTLEIIDIKSDKENCKIYLVKDTVDGDLYIKRMFSGKTSLGVYKSLMCVKHSNLPGIIKVIESDSGFVVVEEYVHGKTLHEKLLNGKPLSESQVMGYAIQLCEVLELLHGMNPPVIHRDIKPSNIICSNDGIIKLIDFDAAKEYKASAMQDTVTLGTKVYAAPEQFGYAKVDEKTDIYCLGTTMFQLLTGTLYIPKQNIDAYNGKMASIIKKCVQIDPDNRYKSISQLKSDFEEIRSGKRRSRSFFPDLQYASPKKRAVLTPLFTIITFVVVSLTVILAIEIEGDTIEKFDTLVFLVCFLVIPCFLALNLFGVRNRIPLFKRKTPIRCIVGIIIVTVILSIVFFVAFALLEGLRAVAI